MHRLDPETLAAVAEELSSAISVRTKFPVRAMTVVPWNVDGRELAPGTPLWVHGSAGSEFDVEWEHIRRKLPRNAVVPVPVRRPSIQRLQTLDECFGAKPRAFREVAAITERECRILQCRKHGAHFLEMHRARGEYLHLVYLGDAPDDEAGALCRRYQAMRSDMLDLREIVALRMRRPPIPEREPPPSKRYHYHFPLECAWAFSFLADRDGFDGPVMDHAGVEQWVDYTKGPYTIHIVMEAGMHPLVEVIHPTGPGGPPAQPYLSLPGIKRAKRIHLLRGPDPEGGSWPYEMPGHLRALAAQFREDEAEFLDEMREWKESSPHRAGEHHGM